MITISTCFICSVGISAATSDVVGTQAAQRCVSDINRAGYVFQREENRPNVSNSRVIFCFVILRRRL
jgi:hypothetical protein